MAFLRHVIQGVPHEYVLGTKTVIGRSSECDFAFPDQTISRKHCRIVRRGDRYCIRDLNSTAGTFVNSELLSEERVLRDGDCITIGPCTLEFVKGERRVSAGATERPADDGTTEPPTTLRIKKSIDSQGPFEIESIVPPQKKHMKRVQVLRDIKDQLSRLSHHATREELFSLTLEKVSSHLGGDRASILLRDERISQMKVVAITPPTKSGRRQFGVPARFEELVMADRKALLIQDAPRDERLKGSQSTVEQGIRSAVMAPLFLERECIGFIEVDSTTQSDLYDEYDLNFLSDVAQALSSCLVSSVESAPPRDGREQPLVVIGDSPCFRQVMELAKRVARRDVTVLLLGERGTGKNVLAEEIHKWSPRRDAPFNRVNCPWFQDALLESVLFGHRKGAFTDASEPAKGITEETRGGTLFLDEIADISEKIQSKLLDLLDSKTFRPLGAAMRKKADVRIIASTNKDLKAEVENGRFRQDLFDRLNVMPICLPPLRDRKDDIPLLASHFLETYRQHEEDGATGISHRAMRMLLDYDWPGNVRELENMIQKALILCQEPEIQPNHLSIETRKSCYFEFQPMKYHDAVWAFSKWYIEMTLSECTSQRQAARRLGLNETYLAKLIKKFGIKH
jgi:transcriptional regulator with GAF, ATPase, and Fis domain